LALWKNYKVAQKWKFYPKVEIADMPKMEISTFSTWAEREPKMAPETGEREPKMAPETGPAVLFTLYSLPFTLCLCNKQLEKIPYLCRSNQ
jgi:hypothetical protein